MMAKSVGVACTTAQAQLVEDHQDAIFAAGATLNGAEALWRDVKQLCSTSNANRMSAAQDAFMLYIRYTVLQYRDNPAGIIGGDKSAPIVAHWDLAFPYVNYAQPGLLPNTLTVGAARVITRSEMAADSVEFGIPSVAAMQTQPQVSGGDPRGHLFVIFPETGTCNPQTALTESNACFNFKAFPSAVPGAFNPRVKVGICAELNFVAPGFAHYTGTGTNTTIEPTIQYPGHAFCDGQEPERRYGIFGRVTRLASKVFGVKRAYAAHGGLGTLAPGFSTFVPVERNVFMARFGNVTLGSAPDSGEIAPPDRGYWTRVFSTPPGSIAVQASLGDLNTQPVVLNQGGGACANNCGGLDLWGQIETADNSRAVAGRVSVSWHSVQDHAAPKEAPFILRSSTGAEIARVAYVKAQGGTRIKFNNQVVADWVKGQYQSFSIILDFVAGTATLTVKNSAGSVVHSSTQNIRNNATDFSQINAEFTNIDSGVVGWDNIVVERLPDSQ